MATVATFVRSPSELLYSCTKDDLLKLTDYYDVGEKWLKEEIKGVLRSVLME